MAKLRIMFVDMPARIGSEILERIGSFEPDFVAMPVEASRDDLEALLEQEQPDAVVLGMHPTEVSEICRKLMDTGSSRIVVGVVDDGRRMVFHVDDLGPEAIVRTIRAAAGASPGMEA